MTIGDAFKALADPTRRRILHLLQQGDMTAGEIAAQFDISKPSISHHLNILKQADLVQDLRRGQNICYSLNTTVFQELIAWFYEITRSSGKSADEAQGEPVDAQRNSPRAEEKGEK